MFSKHITSTSGSAEETTLKKTIGSSTTIPKVSQSPLIPHPANTLFSQYAHPIASSDFTTIYQSSSVEIKV